MDSRRELADIFGNLLARNGMAGNHDSTSGLGTVRVVAVDIRRNEIFQTPGRFGWTGGLGTSAYTDPAEAMIGILLTQRMMESPEPPKVFTDFWTLAYGAME